MKKILNHLASDWYKYLLELIVIMAGILGAYSLNNWNESRKDRLVEYTVLRQLLEDYEANLIQLEQKIEMRNAVINSGYEILRGFDQPQIIDDDSLIIHIAQITMDPTYDPINNNLLSSGNIRLIRNNRLRQLLSNWSSDIIALKELEVIWQKISYEQLAPLLSKMGLARDANDNFNRLDHEGWLIDGSLFRARPIGKSKNLPDRVSILSNLELEGIASYAMGLNSAANEQSQALRKKIEEILVILKNDIKQLE